MNSLLHAPDLAAEDTVELLVDHGCYPAICQDYIDDILTLKLPADFVERTHLYLPGGTIVGLQWKGGEDAAEVLAFHHGEPARLRLRLLSDGAPITL